MDERQLDSILSNELEDVFKGVFSSDEIETLDNDFLAAYVFNTKPDSQRDEH